MGLKVSSLEVCSVQHTPYTNQSDKASMAGMSRLLLLLFIEADVDVEVCG